MMPLAVTGNRDMSSRTISPAVSRGQKSGFTLGLFLFSLLLPIMMDIGGQLLDPHRLVLMILFVPYFIQLARGDAGRFTIIDAFMLIFALWMMLTLIYHHGASRIPYAAIYSIELLGGYVFGRILIRNIGEYKRFIRYFLFALLVMLPLAVDELFNARMLLSDIFAPFFQVEVQTKIYRLGLARVQVAFPHSILFGLFCSLAMASTYYLFKGSAVRLLPRMALVIGMTLMSLSSAPMLSLMLQGAMIVWDKLTNGKWKLLVILFVSVVAFLELASNRGAVVIMIENLTLDPITGWTRIYIWQFGSEAVRQNMLLGIGLNDWNRPEWLTPSVDNFWLVLAMRHGLPCFLFLSAAITMHFFYSVRARHTDPDTINARKGYLITLVGLIFLLTTVHVWSEMAVFVTFFIGAGSFLYTAVPSVPIQQGEIHLPEQKRVSFPYSRFAPRHDRVKSKEAISRSTTRTHK